MFLKTTTAVLWKEQAISKKKSFFKNYDSSNIVQTLQKDWTCKKFPFISHFANYI